MTNAEKLAVAVLRGDREAALILADCVHEEWSGVEKPIQPFKSLNIDRGKLRAVIRTYPELGGDVDIDVDRTREAYFNWLEHGGPLFLVGCSIEFYELDDKGHQGGVEWS